MRFRALLFGSLAAAWGGAVSTSVASLPLPKKAVAACRVGVVEGEVDAGKGFEQEFGNGLKLWFQPIVSGWIVRVVPVAGPLGAHDYAELATPPYRSMTPLSLSTDFAFRAQDAVGWNPRRFRFAPDAAEFRQLSEAYARYESAGAIPPTASEEELAQAVSKAAEGKLTIVDATLVPGTADQWRMAAAVSSRFATTAHTLAPPADGRQTALGNLVRVRFRVELALPETFKPAAGLKVLPHACGGL